MTMPERRSLGSWWVWLVAGPLVVALVAALLVWWQPISELAPDQEQIRTWVEGLGSWGPIAIIFLELIQALLAPIPGQAIEAASGYLYGPFWGTVFPLIGMVVGSTILFLLSRRFGRPLVIRLVGRQSMTRLDDLVRRGGAPFFFLIWLFPFAPDDLACAAAGLTPMPIQQFLILMTLGRLPGVFVSVMVGANATRIEPLWWGILLTVIAIAALILWRWGDQIQEAVLGFIERLGRQVSG
jgi:uncharacterized membrane protein YdjX (TVP38/TMEM64 family)